MIHVIWWRRGGRELTMGMSSRARLSGVVAALVVTGGLLAPSTAAGVTATASITLKPKVGPPTTRTKVVGAGFGASEQVVIDFDSSQVGTATTDPTGSFKTKITVPASARPGDHQVTATGQTSGLSASKTFLVRTDWNKFHFDRRNSGYNRFENVLGPSNVANLGVTWSRKVGKTDNYSSPAVAEGVVYVGTTNGHLYALNASTGAVKWSRALGISSSPTVADGAVYVGSWDQSVYALDASTGAIKWSYLTGGGVVSSPAVANGLVYVGSNDTKVYALRAASGALKWSYQDQAGYAVTTAPAVTNGLVYVGSGSSFYALDAGTGALKWSYETGNSVLASPAVANGVVYAGSYDHNVYALNSLTGALKWSYSTGTVYSSPAVANGLVYVGSMDSFDSNLYALDADTGTLEWSYPVGSDIWSSPAVANGVVYLGADKVYALEATTGALKWTYRTGGFYIYDSPAVVNGMVYLGSTDHNMYAFGLPG